MLVGLLGREAQPHRLLLRRIPVPVPRVVPGVVRRGDEVQAGAVGVGRGESDPDRGVPAPGNFYVNLPPLSLGDFSPIFFRFFPVFSPFSPSDPQDSGKRHQDPEKRSVTVEKRRVKNPKLT